jgi:thiol-disulfide isomerase/thioredoxin
MKIKLYIVFGAVVFLSGFSSVYAEKKTAAAPNTVQDIYPGLTCGALSYASLKTLPVNILLQAEGIKITQEDIDKIIASQPEPAREELKKNVFFVLEQEATSRILLSLAKKTLAQSKAEIPKEDSAVITRFFEATVFKTLDVTDAEIKDFYEKNKDMCGGAPLDQLKSSLKEYVLGQKKQQAASDYVRDMGKQIPIQVSESWVKQQAALAFDNPVDKARQSKKPSMVDFGATGCRPCDMMAPILETLRKKYEGKANVLFVHVRQQQFLALRYGVQSIPIQVFFDKDGKEVFRHTGFFAQEEIEKKLKELGVQ